MRVGVRPGVRACVRAGVKRPRALVGLGSGWSLTPSPPPPGAGRSGRVGARALRGLFASLRPDGALGLQARARRAAGWQGCGSPREAAEAL